MKTSPEFYVKLFQIAEIDLAKAMLIARGIPTDELDYVALIDYQSDPSLNVRILTRALASRVPVEKLDCATLINMYKTDRSEKGTLIEVLLHRIPVNNLVLSVLFDFQNSDIECQAELAESLAMKIPISSLDYTYLILIQDTETYPVCKLARKLAFRFPPRELEHCELAEFMRLYGSGAAGLAKDLALLVEDDLLHPNAANMYKNRELKGVAKSVLDVILRQPVIVLEELFSEEELKEVDEFTEEFFG